MPPTLFAIQRELWQLHDRQQQLRFVIRRFCGTERARRAYATDMEVSKARTLIRSMAYRAYFRSIENKFTR